ncbi:CTN [Linum perenne]
MGKRKLDNEIAAYMANKAQRKAMKVAKKLKGQTVSGYSNDSNPFGDSNLNEKFVWRKKIEKDVHQGVSLDEFSVKAEKKRQRERMAEIEKVKKRREERALEKAHHEEEMALLARERARAEFHDLEKKEMKRMAVLEEQQRRIREAMASKQPPPPPSDNFELKAIKAMGVMEEGDAVFGSGAEVSLDSAVYWWHDKYRPRKPKYFNRVHTGYEWNKYNQTHYDHDNPPPKTVQGYKFNIFYPDLVDKTKAPTYTIDRDGNSDETCIIRFHAGPPYEDVAFRIVNKEWEYSHKKGFKCTFERGILHVYFNFIRHRYRR